MPSVSKRQQAFMGAELARKRAGKRTRTGMSEAQLADFAATATKDLPEKARPKGSAPFTNTEIARGYRRLPS